MSAYDIIVARLDGVRPFRSAQGILRSTRAHCPAHQIPPHKPGRERTLSVAETQSGDVLLKCHAGCSSIDVLAAVGLKLSDLYPRGEGGNHRQKGDPRGTAWASAAAAADAVAERALMIAIDPSPDNIDMMITAANEFSDLARAALRRN